MFGFGLGWIRGMHVLLVRYFSPIRPLTTNQTPLAPNILCVKRSWDKP